MVDLGNASISDFRFSYLTPVSMSFRTIHFAAGISSFTRKSGRA